MMKLSQVLLVKVFLAVVPLAKAAKLSDKSILFGNRRAVTRVGEQ